MVCYFQRIVDKSKPGNVQFFYDQDSSSHQGGRKRQNRGDGGPDKKKFQRN